MEAPTPAEVVFKIPPLADQIVAATNAHSRSNLAKTSTYLREAVKKAGRAPDHNEHVGKIWGKRQASYHEARNNSLRNRRLFALFVLLPLLVVGTTLFALGQLQHLKPIKITGLALLGVAGLVGLSYNVWARNHESDRFYLFNEDAEVLQKQLVGPEAPLLKRKASPVATHLQYSSLGFG